ncbi:MAG TPA: HlyD family secretion protein [Xanthobacteraceae bacterium]|jgi:membrane fusion protein (multidrug efflux system)|nr:HlyD family secretion protein [Xanthobacteraceae bacterium]
MDQRVDNERRPDSERVETPARRAASSFDEADTRSWRYRLRKRRGFIPLLVIGGIIVAALLVGWWLHARNYESTDDAFIDSRTVQISAQVAAAIVDVPVTDNQLVDGGTELVRLDDRDYVAQRDQAQAQVNQGQSSIDNLTAQIAAQQAKVDQADKQVAQAQAALTFARQQADRYQQLASKGSGTVEQAQQYVSNLQQSEAALAAAQANATATDKQIGVLQAQRDLAFGQLAQARATLEQAQANLTRTIITAPVAGRVTKLTAAKGGYAAVGQALMMFVPREVWVTANFKETQLNLMRPGQPVGIAIDAYPGRTFAGHVDSVQSGSGTAFSLLPAENATGNYVKIVQRVPVKISFDKIPDVLLGPGMSVVPTVKVR